MKEAFYLCFEMFVLVEVGELNEIMRNDESQRIGFRKYGKEYIHFD